MHILKIFYIWVHEWVGVHEYVCVCVCGAWVCHSRTHAPHMRAHLRMHIGCMRKCARACALAHMRCLHGYVRLCSYMRMRVYTQTCVRPWMGASAWVSVRLILNHALWHCSISTPFRHTISDARNFSNLSDTSVA